MIEILKTDDVFKALEGEWEELFLNAKDVTFFQTFKYNWIAWNVFATEYDKLHILIYRTGKKVLQAIFPFYLDKKGCLRFINDIHTDFCNVIVSKEVVTIHNLMYDVWKNIRDDAEVKFVFLDNVLQNSPVLSYWKVFFGNAFVFSQTEHSWLNCVQSENVLKEFNHLTNKEKCRLTAVQKKSANSEIKVYYKENEPYPEKVVMHLVEEMIGCKTRSSGYLSSSMLTFMKELYDNGLVEIPVVYDNEEPISLGFQFVNETKDFTMIWVILYKDKQFNLWNNIRYVVDKSQRGASTFNFGRGGYDYKMHNFRPQVENLYRFMASKTKWGNWYVLFKIAASHMRKTLKKYKG